MTAAPLRRLGSAVLLATLLAPPGATGAGHMAPQEDPAAFAEEVRDVGSGNAAPAGLRVIRDIAYGNDPLQRFDVYTTTATTTGNNGSKPAPVIFMVHGGAWRMGSKNTSGGHKAAHWVPKGFVLISTDYRLVPQVDPLEQARDVARAVAVAQARAAEWGADRERFILMGHSAGAHLVALLATTPALAEAAGLTTPPWLGTVALDSAAYDIVDIMRQRHPPLYNHAFGGDPAYWQAASPFHAPLRGSKPLMAVCSTQRRDACPQAHAFAGKARTLGVTVEVLGKDLSHRDINRRLGEEARYTAEVDNFLRSLDPVVARLLTGSR